MTWRFTILNNRTAVATVIEEPNLWDSNLSDIIRDPIWHGVFFTSQGDAFEFDGIAERLLREEYEAYGIEANMTLIMEEDCGQGFEEFDRGKFNFGKYEHDCDDGECYVRCPIEGMDDVMMLRNNKSKKVDLQALKSFDGVTDMTPYDKINFDMVLPSKGIFIQDEFQNENEFTTPVQGVPADNNPGTPIGNSEYGMIEVGFDKIVSQEIGLAGCLDQSLYSCVQTYAGTLGCTNIDRFTWTPALNPIDLCPLNATPWINFQEGSPNYEALQNPCKLNLQINGFIEILSGNINTVYFVLLRLPKGKVGNLLSDYEFLFVQPIVDEHPGPGFGTGDIISLAVSYTDNNFRLDKGDRIYGIYTLYNYRLQGDILTGSPSFQMTFDAGNFFTFTDLSHTPATISKVNAIMETISRVAEVITDDRLRAYSDYFGRTDSQPYPAAADGCGSLAVVTDGLRIRRQETKTPGETTPFTISMDDIFTGLCPVHNIGIGIEPDPARLPFNRLRMEPWYHFYNDSVIMSCTDVKKITRKVNEKEIYSSFKFGFQKWEAEEFNGLDEFLTKRSYRTRLSQVSNELVQVCTMILSGYAIEVTRRKGKNDSKDWRYDKETFLISATRTRKFHVIFDAAGNKMTFSYDGDGSEFLGPGTITIAGSANNNGTRTIFVVGILTVPGEPVVVEIGFSGGSTVDEESWSVTFPGIVSPAGLFVELGEILTPNNIIDPDTIYNYRRSPLRNAMRWMNKILMSYRNFDVDAKIIFTDGDGNIFAEGELASGGCKLENGVIKENQDLNKDNFADEDDARPFLLPERIVFDHDMTSRQFKAIKANPGGLIYFENDCDSGYGYIDKISYHPEEGVASFSLIPKITDPLSDGEDGMIYEDGIDILTEDLKHIFTE